MNRYTIQIFQQVDDQLKKSWRELWETSSNGNVFNSYEWFEMSLQSLSFTRYEIVACFEGKKLVAVFPLTPSKCFGIPVWVPVGHEFIVDTTLLLQDYSKELVSFFFSQVLRNRNVYITTLDERIVSLLSEIDSKLFFSLISVNPYIDFGKDPLRYVSGSNKKTMRKVIKNMGSDLEFVECVTQEEKEEGFAKMVEIEQKSSKKQQSKDIFAKAENVNFYSNIVKYSGRFVRIFFLLYQGKPIVYAFILAHKAKAIGYQTSYLSEYRKLSPGKMMFSYLFSALQKDGIDVLDLGGGVSSYKQEFTPLYFFQYNLYYSNNIAYMLWWKGINTLRRLKQIFFPLKYTRDHEFLFLPFLQTDSKKQLCLV